METIIALMIMSVPKLPLKYIGHCYSDNENFNPRIIKIIEVGKTEYKFEYRLAGVWVGIMVNSIDTVNEIYKFEIKCDKNK